MSKSTLTLGINCDHIGARRAFEVYVHLSDEGERRRGEYDHRSDHQIVMVRDEGHRKSSIDLV